MRKYSNFSIDKKVTLVSKHYFKHFFCKRTTEIYPGRIRGNPKSELLEKPKIEMSEILD